MAPNPMRSQSSTPDEYLESLPPDRRQTMAAIRKAILKNLPNGFAEIMNYGMIGYVVPKTLYPAGYHCDPKLPLPFMNLASQKNYIALYHMGLYSDKKMLAWFTEEFAKQSRTKLDMGKSCIRFKEPESIPLKLIGELAGKIAVKEWIALYEKAVKR